MADEEALTTKPEVPEDVWERLSALADDLDEQAGPGDKDDADAIRAALEALGQSAPSSDCPSCGGLNISCPHGCGRDPRTGELDGSTLGQIRRHCSGDD